MSKGQQDVLDGRVDLSMEDLPENIMFDVLSRLPIKTIIYCKCVCKKWRNILLDSYFAELHLPRSSQNLLVDQYSFTRGTRQGTLMWIEIDHHRLLNEPLSIMVDLNVNELLHKDHINLVGSVNGFICMWAYGPDNTYICNPITKEYMILPEQRFYIQDMSMVLYGLGVSTSGEYKVVRIFRNKTSKGIEVYTLGTDQWRSLGQIPFDFSGYKYNHGLFFKNHVHWIISNSTSDGSKKLCTIDLENEEFQSNSSPLDEYKVYQIRSQLAFLKDCLSLFCYSYYIQEYTLWVMTEHGNENSWHKDLVIKESIVLQELKVLHPFSLVDGLSGTTILMMHYTDNDKDKDKVLLYCLETSTLKCTLTISYKNITAMTYRPSFLKLPVTSNKTSQDSR